MTNKDKISRLEKLGYEEDAAKRKEESVVESKKFCQNCGKTVKENQKFCGYCGTPLSMPLEVPAENSKTYTETPEVTQPASTQHKVVVQKSPWTAALLAFLFGPFGLLYVSMKDFFLGIVVAIVVMVVTFGYGGFILLFVWPIWGYYAAQKWNDTHSNRTNY